MGFVSSLLCGARGRSIRAAEGGNAREKETAHTHWTRPAMLNVRVVETQQTRLLGELFSLLSDYVSCTY